MFRRICAHFILLGAYSRLFWAEKGQTAGEERERERERNGADGEGDDSDGVRALVLRAGAGEQARTPRQERIGGERKGVKERKKERKKEACHSLREWWEEGGYSRFRA